MALTRRAVLIGSPCGEVSDETGTEFDVAEWARFLLSDMGGAWEDGEIRRLVDPAESELTEELRQAGSRDYSLVAYSGHGLYRGARGSGSTYVDINDQCRLPVHRLNTGSPRCTVVVDACRSVERIRVLEGELLVTAQKSMGQLLTRAAYRELYDDALLEGEGGLVEAFGCSIGETAGGYSHSGGIFTEELLLACRNWLASAVHLRAAVLTWDIACKYAAAAVTSRRPQQHPEYAPGRRYRHFPLAVKP